MVEEVQPLNPYFNYQQIYGEQSEHSARIYKEFAQHLQERHEEKGRPEYSTWNHAANIKEDDYSAEGRIYYQKAIDAFQNNGDHYDPRIADCLIGLAKLIKQEKGRIITYQQVQGEDFLQFNLLKEAIDIIEVSVGVDHPDTAELYTKIALAYQEVGSMINASPWIRKSFCIFSKLFGIDDEITVKTFEYLKTIEIYVDEDGLNNVPIEEMCEVIEKLDVKEEYEEFQETGFQI